MAKMDGCKVDFINGTITVTKKFADMMGDMSSEAYIYYYSLKQDFPQLRLVRRAARKPRKRSVESRLTYEIMLRFIECQPEAAQLIQEYLRIKDLAKKHPHPIQYVRAWFVGRFPDHNKVPKFDKNGKIISYIAPKDVTAIAG